MFISLKIIINIIKIKLFIRNINNNLIFYENYNIEKENKKNKKE